MNPKKYLPTSQAFIEVAGAEAVGASNALLEAVNIKREELRDKNENHPKESPEDLTGDYRFIAGMISMANWILGLPERSREYRNKLDNH